LLGFDPIWFSIVFLLNMQVAYLTPPFGWALILMKGIAPTEVNTGDIWRSVPPFVGIQILVLILTILFPQIALWLPDKMF
jgi:TRAP-type mannitol/chloroaromatic compound transport system permease large subunit